MRELTGFQREWLEGAQAIGFLGPKPVEMVHEHALGFASVVDGLMRAGVIPPSFASADLGSGAGIPGLFLALWFPDSKFVLVDSMRKRHTFLLEMVSLFGLSRRVEVYGGRSEDFAMEQPEAFDLVTARSFAVPSATAENASGLLKEQGVLVVSEPPNSSGERWDDEGLRILGFSPPTLVKNNFSFCWMAKTERIHGRFPRGVGIPEKDPLF